MEKVLYDPLIGKLVTAILGLIVVNIIVRFLQRTATSRIKEKNARYGLRRGLGFLGYLAAIFFLLAIFSDQLNNLVALGVAVQASPLPYKRSLPVLPGGLLFRSANSIPLATVCSWATSKVT